MRGKVWRVGLEDDDIDADVKGGAVDRPSCIFPWSEILTSRRIASLGSP